jgi:hypothetical protein
MANLFGSLFFTVARGVVAGLMVSFLGKAGRNFLLWADTKVQGRRAKLVIGGLLGLAAYVLFPIVMSLLP